MGESGVGKECLQSVERAERPGNGPFVAINYCAGNSRENLVEARFWRRKRRIYWRDPVRVAAAMRAGRARHMASRRWVSSLNMRNRASAARTSGAARSNACGDPKQFRCPLCAASSCAACNVDLATEGAAGVSPKTYISAAGLSGRIPPRGASARTTFLLLWRTSGMFNRPARSRKLMGVPAGRDALLKYDYPGNIRETAETGSNARVVYADNGSTVDIVPCSAGRTCCALLTVHMSADGRARAVVAIRNRGGTGTR